MVNRSGFGLVEAIVASMLLAIGLLGLAATAGVAARISRESEAAERAAFQASQVLDSLAAQADPRDGSARAGSMRLTWTVSKVGSQIAAIELTVRYTDGTRVRNMTYAVTTVLP